MTDDSDQGAAFLMFVAIVVGVSGMFLYCSFFLLKLWLCGRGRRDITGVSDNFSFNLSSRQRRDVLETIFSDASKAVTEAMLFKGKKNVTDPDSANGIVQNVTDLQTDADSVDLEANADDKMTMEPFAVKELVLSPMQVIDTEFDVSESTEHRTNEASPDLYIRPRRKLPWQKRPETSSTPSLSLPSMNEDYEEMVAPKFPSNFIANSSVVDTHCFNSDESDGNDDDEQVCAICLSSYKKGETILTSKYCNHVFHKDCILEWLDNKDECPCCRTDMVTSQDVNKATAELVGKTRMIKAVESMRIRDNSILPGRPRSLTR